MNFLAILTKDALYGTVCTGETRGLFTVRYVKAMEKRY